ncbi:unnamed protein product [Lymnaea stagnalis]|uniref:Uncharacterized protein n=1 Tax=Lymnaea stagnalis TaxID=6523 RepID=A0AAV2H376_LYMST
MCESLELVQAKRRISNFVSNMREFPCSFNLGDATILDGPLNIARPTLRDDTWLFLKKHLREEDDDDDAELIQRVWRQNVLVRVHAELHNVRKSLKFCTDLVHTLPDNLVAHANLAFVYLLKGDMSMAETQLSLIKERKFSDDARLDAVAEQCYTYFKISGNDKNLTSATELIKYVLRFRPKDDRLRLMLAVLYRRLSRYKKNMGRDQSANRVGYVTKSVEELKLLRTLSSSTQIKAVAIIELALLKKDMRLLEEWEKTRLMGAESVEDLCALAIGLSPTSTIVLTTAGQILVTLRKMCRAEKILTQILEKRTCPKAYLYLGILYQNKAVQFEQERVYKTIRRESVDLQKLALPEYKVRLIKLLTDITGNILFFSDDNILIQQTLNIFKMCINMDFCDDEMLRKIALKFMQCRDYITALKVCQKLVREDRSCAQQTTCHSVMYHMAAICCSQMASTLQDEKEQEKLYSMAEGMILSSIRVMASLVSKQSDLKTRNELWGLFRQKPDIQEMDIKDSVVSNNESLGQLVAYYKEAVPVLKALVDKPEGSWLDIGNLERDLTFCEAEGITKALLYLDFLKLKGDKACQLTWQNSSVVRSIKLDAAKKVLRHHQADDNPDPIWQEIFNEEYELEPQVKLAPLGRLDALLQLKTYDVVIVGTEDELTRQVVECLKDIFGQVLGMIVLDVAQLPSLEQQMVVSSSAQVVIFVMNVNTRGKLADESRQPTQPIEPTKQSSRSKQPMETFENSQSNLTIEQPSESSQSCHLMEPSNHNSQLNQNIKPCIERRQAKQIFESSDQSSKANQLTELSNQISQSKQPFEASNESSQSKQTFKASNERSQSKQPFESSNESSQSKQPFEASSESSESSEPIQPDAEKVDLNSGFVAIRHACLNLHDHENSPKQILNIFTGPFSTQGSPRELRGHQSLHLTCNDLKVMSFMSPGVDTFESNFSDDIPTLLTGGSVNDRPISNVTGGSANDRPISNQTGASSNAPPDLVIHKTDSKVNNDASVKVVMKIFKGIVRQLPYDI